MVVCVTLELLVEMLSCVPQGRVGDFDEPLQRSVQLATGSPTADIMIGIERNLAHLCAQCSASAVVTPFFSLAGAYPIARVPPEFIPKVS